LSATAATSDRSGKTTIYVGDVMTLVGAMHDVERAAARVGQVLRYGDRTDIAFLAAGIAAGLLIGLLSMKVGSFAVALGGTGGTLLVGLTCGWLRARRPTVGSFPPAAQQTLSDIGLGGFIAAIGLANGPAAIAAIRSHGLLLLIGHGRYARSVDDRDHRGASYPVPEPGHHLWRARER
jgi:putative transport protein